MSRTARSRVFFWYRDWSSSIPVCPGMRMVQSSRGVAGIRLRRTNKTPAGRLRANPEEHGERHNGHDLEAGNRPLIAEADVQRVLEGICRRGQQDSQLIREPGHQTTRGIGGKL